MAADRALFRWVGGKSYAVPSLAPLIRAHLELHGGQLVSLFYGSGAIERAVGGPQIGGEACPELLGLFEDLQLIGPDRVHEALLAFDKKLGRTRKAYDVARNTAHLSAPARSARFLWLSAMAFNGVWRVNSRGEMNMPPDPARLGSATALPPIDAVREFAEQIRLTRFVRGWSNALASAGPKDVVIADPPYMGKGAFRAYTAIGFPDVDQRYLAGKLREHVQKGGAFIAFNSPAAAHLYAWACVDEQERSGQISSDGDGREPVTEIVIAAGFRAQGQPG